MARNHGYKSFDESLDPSLLPYPSSGDKVRVVEKPPQPGYANSIKQPSIGNRMLKPTQQPNSGMATADPTKRLILCCDGTWMDSYDGYQKPTLIPYQPEARLQIPSNVTRISRALTKTGLDGKPQIIYYHSGVGTGSSAVDTIAGGLLGKGISENIREAYSFIAANYVPGDEIILIGFSRGAFTVRSVAGMIKEIGLLTRAGMAVFFPIFKDHENFRNEDYRDLFPAIPFVDKPRGGPQASNEYKQRLLDAGLTRVFDPDGTEIVVRAVAVWDTVGSLGIPKIPYISRLGLQRTAKEYKFYDTNLSGHIKHAFQALALDEHRAPFKPAVWERNNLQKTTIDLRQVWFPGAHSNIGGGYDDQGVANITLAWMMDQLASIGVAFQDEVIDKIFADSVQYYEGASRLPARAGLFSRKSDVQWAKSDIYDKHKPVRPWGLGEIYESDRGFWILAGKACRTPGLNTRADPHTDTPTTELLTHTNERVHSSVRIRLHLEGLDVNDKSPYKCHALLEKGLWRLRHVRMAVNDPITSHCTWGGMPPLTGDEDDRRWVWEYAGPEDTAPVDRIMVEENLGPYERKLLLLNKVNDSYKRHRRRRSRRSRKRDSLYADLGENFPEAPPHEKEDYQHRRYSSYDEARRTTYLDEIYVEIEDEKGEGSRQYDINTEHIRGDGIVVENDHRSEGRQEWRRSYQPSQRRRYEKEDEGLLDDWQARRISEGGGGGRGGTYRDSETNY